MLRPYRRLPTACRRPTQPGPELFSHVADDLRVVVLVEGKRQCERDLVGPLKAGMRVKRVGEFIGGADVVGGEQHAPRALRCLGPLEWSRSRATRCLRG